MGGPFPGEAVKTCPVPAPGKQTNKHDLEWGFSASLPIPPVPGSPVPESLENKPGPADKNQPRQQLMGEARAAIKNLKCFKQRAKAISAR